MHYSVEKRATVRNQGVGYNQCGYMANHGNKVKRQLVQVSKLVDANDTTHQSISDKVTAQNITIGVDTIV